MAIQDFLRTALSNKGSTYDTVASSEPSEEGSEKSHSEDTESDRLSESEGLLHEKGLEIGHSGPHQKPHSVRSTWIILLLASTVLIYLASAMLLLGFVRRESLDQRCLRRLNPYSPIIEAGVVKFHEENFENSPGHQTVFIGPPTVEREDIWDKLWHYGAIKVPLERLADLNKTDNAETPFTRVPPEQGEGYAALVEGFHQMHCLNLIRQFTWIDSYDELPEGWAPDSELGNRMHVDHCIETLRLSLMCYADATPFFIEAKSSSSHESDLRADFNVHHKCRNFYDIVDWTKANIAVP